MVPGWSVCEVGVTEFIASPVWSATGSCLTDLCYARASPTVSAIAAPRRPSGFFATVVSFAV